jgi:prevent-host-death family protein
MKERKTMFSIGVSEFRTNLNQVLQKVQNGEIVSITVRGTEVARLVPSDFAKLSARTELEKLRQSAIVGDVLSPVVKDQDWEAAQ